MAMASNFRRVFTSSVGTKLLIGLTGLALFAYLILHLAGNALIFLGQDTFNEYSHTLDLEPADRADRDRPARSFSCCTSTRPPTMWIANQSARPVRYQKKRRAGHTSRKSVASSTMIVTGHDRRCCSSWCTSSSSSTARTTPRRQPGRPRSLSHRGRRLPPAGVGRPSTSSARRLSPLHLRHGIASGFQSIGFDHPLYTRRLVTLGHHRRDRRRRRARRHSASRLPDDVRTAIMQRAEAQHHHDTRLQESPAARSRTSGIATASSRSW